MSTPEAPIGIAGGRRRSRRSVGLALVAGLAVIAAACGGSTASSAPSAAPASQAPTSAAPSTAPSVAPSDAGYTGPPATISYSIWGDPQEIKNQQAIVDAFHVANPNITVNVDVSDWEPYWDKLQTGLAGGAAPDVFAMDGPLFPDYQSRDVLLDLKPYIDRDGYDLGQLADQAVADFTTPDGQFGLPRDLNVVALYYNKKMFDAAGLPYPDDTWDWAKLVEVAKKLTLKGANGKVSQWGLYTETTDMENYWSELVWQNGGDIISRRQEVQPRRERPGGRWDPVPPGPRLEGQGHARIRRSGRRDIGDAFEQGKAAMESNGSWLVADPRGRRHRLRDRAVAEGPGGPGHLDQPDRSRGLQEHEEPGRGMGVREVPGQPGGPGQAHGAQGVAAGEQGGPRRTVLDARSRAPRSSPTRSPMPTSSRRSRATTSGPRRSRRSSTRTSSRIRRRPPKQALTDVLRQLDGILASQ